MKIFCESCSNSVKTTLESGGHTAVLAADVPDTSLTETSVCIQKMNFQSRADHCRLWNRNFKVLPYLVLKLAGCGCPSYKDKKSYSSSTAKDWKTIWILFPSSARITQVQFAPFGYPYGNPGLSIVPFLPFKVPPQVWMKPEKEEQTFIYYQMPAVNVKILFCLWRGRSVICEMLEQKKFIQNPLMENAFDFDKQP